MMTLGIDYKLLCKIATEKNKQTSLFNGNSSGNSKTSRQRVKRTASSIQQSPPKRSIAELILSTSNAPHFVPPEHFRNSSRMSKTTQQRKQTAASKRTVDRHANALKVATSTLSSIPLVGVLIGIAIDVGAMICKEVIDAPAPDTTTKKKVTTKRKS